MAVYRCRVCEEIYDESVEKVPFSELPSDWICPVCGSPRSAYESIDERGEPIPGTGSDINTVEEASDNIVRAAEKDLRVNRMLAKRDGGVMDQIHRLAISGTTEYEPMDTLYSVPKFDDILILGAQLDPFPKLMDEEVGIRTVIGKSAKRPMVMEMPVFVSHMSYGALSSRAKEALAAGSAMARTAIGSGEGGALPREMEQAYRYILEYVPNKYSSDKKTLAAADAVEIKIGQGTKPGMGGHLPGVKVTEQIAALRGKPVGEDIVSPSRFEEIKSPEDLRSMVDALRSASGGKPVGVKIAAGHIERDIEFISRSGCDFITIDGRGGGTASSPKFLKDASSVPTVYALSRARRCMDDLKMDQDLIITGGLRTSKDFAKAIAMGADAVATASAAVMALGCQRYRICNTGRCPMGVATQDPELEKRLDVEVGAQRVANFLNGTAEELRNFVRITGRDDIHDLSLDDLCTTDSEISENTGIRHA